MSPNYDYATPIETFGQALATALPDGVTGVLGISDNDRDLSRGPVFDLRVEAAEGASTKKTAVVMSIDDMAPSAQELATDAVVILEDVWEAIVMAGGFFKVKVPTP